MNTTNDVRMHQFSFYVKINFLKFSETRDSDPDGGPINLMKLKIYKWLVLAKPSTTNKFSKLRQVQMVGSYNGGGDKVDII